MALSPFPPWGARPECPQPRGSLFLLVAPSQALLLGSCSRARPHHTSVCSVPRRDCWRCSCHLQLHLRAAGFVHKAQCPFLHHFPCTSLPASLPVHIPPFIPSCISLNGHPFLHLLPHSSPCSSLPASLPSSLPMHISSCIPSCIPLHAQYSLHSSSYSPSLHPSPCTSLPASLPALLPSFLPHYSSPRPSPRPASACVRHPAGSDGIWAGRGQCPAEPRGVMKAQGRVSSDPKWIFSISSAPSAGYPLLERSGAAATGT